MSFEVCSIKGVTDKVVENKAEKIYKRGAIILMALYSNLKLIDVFTLIVHDPF